MNDILSEIEVEAEVVTERKKQNKYNYLSSEEGNIFSNWWLKNWKIDILNEKKIISLK